MNRRLFIASASAGLATLAEGQTIPDSIRNLKPMTGGIQPITDEERRGRIEKARRLMRENRLDGILCEGGSSVYYFTGSRYSGGLWILPAKGDPVWVVPEADAAKVRGNVRTGSYKSAADALKPAARVGIEERVRFGVYDELHKEAPSIEFVSADPVTVGCRVIKSPAEIALMQLANDITIAAYKAAFATLHEGMGQRELSANIAAAYRALDAPGNAMVIFGKYTAFPHGSTEPQILHEGDMVLVDDGCVVEGYQSDVTRTTVFGKPAARQRRVWDIERKAQDAALAAAKPGATCESVDAAARKVITDAGFGPGYKVPGLPHRTGHGIGLDGHEWTYLVKGNRTRLQPGMCFSNEPTIAIYGEFGVRLEDCMYITQEGARMFTKQSPAIDQPFG
jgi:Xaa-Pro dipeptidase